MNIKVIINFVLFQLGWFACVLGAANNQPWIGVTVVLVVLAWHLKQAKYIKPELILLSIALIIGALFDQLMLSSQLITYEAHGWSNALGSSNIVPIWILALWAVFVTALNVSLNWLKGKWVIAMLFGAIGAPLAYMSAAKLGAVTLNTFPQSHIALGVGWAIITPILVMFAQRFNGFTSKTHLNHGKILNDNAASDNHVGLHKERT